LELVPKEVRDIFREAYRTAADKVQAFFRDTGRVGGLTSSERMTPEQRTARAKKAAAASAKVRSAAKRKRAAKGLDETSGREGTISRIA
jgi:hypothetical protein